MNIQTSGVHHMALRVTDLLRARKFYNDVLGFPIVLEGPDIFLFLAGSTAFAVRAPDALTPEADKFNPFRVGLDHVALGCRDEAELTRVAAALADARVDNTGVRLDPTLQRQYVAFKDPDGIAWEFYMAPDQARSAALSYFDALRNGDVNAMPFADDVRFESPLASCTGAAAVREFLQTVAPAIVDLRIHSLMSEDDTLAARFELVTRGGVVQAFDWFRVANGRIAELRPYYDPRPLLVNQEN